MEIGEVTLATFEILGVIPWDIVGWVLAVGVLVLWLTVAVWVFIDAKKRHKSLIFPILFAILAVVFFIFGYLIYMILRPAETSEDRYWADREKEFLMHEIGDFDVCPNCKYEHIFPEFLNCPNCSYQLKHKCESCEYPLLSGWKNCPSCRAENAKYDVKLVKELDAAKVGSKELIAESSKVNKGKDKVETKEGESKDKSNKIKIRSLFAGSVGFFGGIGAGIIGFLKLDSESRANRRKKLEKKKEEKKKGKAKKAEERKESDRKKAEDKKKDVDEKKQKEEADKVEKSREKDKKVEADKEKEAEKSEEKEIKKKSKKGFSFSSIFGGGSDSKKSKNKKSDKKKIKGISVKMEDDSSEDMDEDEANEKSLEELKKAKDKKKRKRKRKRKKKK